MNNYPNYLQSLLVFYELEGNLGNEIFKVMLKRMNKVVYLYTAMAFGGQRLLTGS
jgi:hypothetical protein